MKDYLEAARITKSVGLKGEVRVVSFCDSPEVLEDFSCLYLGKEKKAVDLLSVRPQKNNMAVLKLGGIDTQEQAEKLRGVTLYIKREDAALPDGLMFIADLIGLEVRDFDTGRAYGVIDEIIQTAPTDVYSIKPYKEIFHGSVSEEGDTGNKSDRSKVCIPGEEDNKESRFADDGKRLLFPAIPEIIKEIDTEGGFMVIKPLPGLFDE